MQVYTPTEAHHWFGLNDVPTIFLGTWDGPDYTTTTQTIGRIQARWNGSYLNFLDVNLYASTGGNPLYGAGKTTAHVVGDPGSYYLLQVSATSSLQEYTLPVIAGSTIHHGDEMWAFLYPSYSAYGTNHWVGSDGTIPSIELCDGDCAPKDPPPCTSDCNDNVLFLPGIEASRLYYAEPPNTITQTPKEVRAWEPSSDIVVQNLALDVSGTSVRPDIYTRDVIDEAYVPRIGPNIYQTFIDSMNTLTSNGTIADWAPVPYDWRLSLDDILGGGTISGSGISYTSVSPDPYILSELKRLASSSRTGKVTIVAHSNGGLLAKALMIRLGPDASKYVDKIIFVDVPQLGTPSAIASLLHGTGQNIPTLLSQQEVRSLAQNFPASYNLLPSADYFTYVDDPVVTFDKATLPGWASAYGAVIHSAIGEKDFIIDSSTTRTRPAFGDINDPEIGNASLYAGAESVHAALDGWTPPAGVQLYLVNGWGKETLAGLDYFKEPVCTSQILGRCLSYADELTFSPRTVIDGDDTVIETSALWTDGATNTERFWVNLDTFNTTNKCWSVYCKGHANILEVPDLDTLITNIITGGSTDSFGYISTAAPAGDGTHQRLHFILHSPLTLGFTDAQGNYTGAVGTSTEESNIPGVDYRRFGDVQWLSVPKNLAGEVVMRGEASGSFTLDVDEVNGDTTIATTTFAGIPSATSTIATLRVDPAVSLAASSTLEVDYDGNGSVDSSLAAKAGAVVMPDVTPPEAFIAFSTSTRSIVITGTDDQSAVISTTTPLYEQRCVQQKRSDCARFAQTKIGDITTLSDESHNTLSLATQTLHPSGDYLESLELTGLKYSTADATTTFNPPATISYAYKMDRKGTITRFSARINAATTTLYALYIPERNETHVIQLARPQRTPKDDDDDYLDGMIDPEMNRRSGAVKKIPGLIIPSIITKQGSVIMNY